MCSVGAQPFPDNSYCECSPGYYQSGASSSQCSQCPAGTISSQAGASGKSTGPFGEENSPDLLLCVKFAESIGCYGCPSNSQPNSAQTQCLCDPGNEESAGLGYLTCQPCSAGSVSPGGPNSRKRRHPHKVHPRADAFSFV